MMVKIELDSAKVEALAALQCTFDKIASGLGVSTDTLGRRRDEDPAIADAIKRGREEGKRSLRRLQYTSAKEGNITMQIWLGKQWLKQTDKQDVTNIDGIKVEVEYVNSPLGDESHMHES